MKQIYSKILLGFSAVCLLAVINVYAQTAKQELILNTPINTQIVKGKPVKLGVKLLAEQTARVEIDFQGMNILIHAYNPLGKKYLTLNSPQGRKGKKVLLVTSENAGDYEIEIKPAHRIPRTIDLKVEATEIRAKIPHDDFVNNAYVKIVELRKVPVPFPNMTLEQQRDALRRYKEIVRLSKLIQDKNFEGFSLITIGHSYWAVGEIQKSLNAWFEARELYRKTKNLQYEGLAINNIAVAYFKLGQYDRMLFYLKEAKTLLGEKINRFDKATLLSNFGKAYNTLNQLDKAKEHFQEALNLYTAMGFKSGVATAGGSLGQVYSKMGDHQKAIELFQQSVELSKKTGNIATQTTSHLALGRAFWELGNKDEAHKQYLIAIELAEKTGRRTSIITSLFRLALVEQDKSNISKAIEYLEKGLKLIETTRSKLGSKDLQATYFSTVQNYYELYADLLIERSRKNNDSNDVSLAFEMSERSRSRSLVDLLQEARVDFKQDINKKLLEKEKDTANALNLKYRSRERLLRRKPTKDKIEKLNTEINNLELELDNIALQIKNENPKYADLTRGKTFTTKDVQGLLDSKTALLEYKLGKNRSHLWLITNNSIKHFELPKRDDIQKKVREFYDLTLVKNTNNLSKELNDMLIGKVQNEVKGKRLAIVADEILQYLPFSALKDSDSNYLIDKNEIVILPSASVLAQIRNNSSNAINNDKTIAIFADPVFDKNDSRLTTKPQTLNVVLETVKRDFRFGETLPRLLASRQEAKNISQLIDKKQAFVKTDFDASVKNIETANLKNYRILHFATHGLLNTTNPELSGLVFSLYDKKGKTQDGFLSLNNIYNLDLNSDMVVLSACQTALGKEVRGEGLIGISRGFLYAGSKRIVASLWKVDDAATAEFMKRFYKNHLQKGMPASKALQQTKIEMKKIKRYKSPYYWSAFTLLGDWK